MSIEERLEGAIVSHRGSAPVSDRPAIAALMEAVSTKVGSFEVEADNISNPELSDGGLDSYREKMGDESAPGEKNKGPSQH